VEGQPRTYSLTITLSDYDRELRYEIRREPQAPVITPKFNFFDEETRYILFNWFSEKRLARPKKRQGQSPVLRTFTERKVAVDYFLDQLEQHSPFPLPRRRQQQSVPHWPDEVSNIVFTSLRTFGFDAIRLNAADAPIVQQNDTRSPSYGFLVSLDRLGTKIGQIIPDWQKRVLEECDLNKRRRVQHYLHEIGKLLVPDARGKREKRIGVSDEAVKKAYYEALFRCELVSALLAKTKDRIRELPLEVLCAAAHLPSTPEGWGFRGEVADPEFTRRNLRYQSAKENACILVANQLGIKVPTVRNIVSR